MAAADVEGRLAASVGELAAVAPCFAPALDVPNGGLLCALPALLAVGLLDGVECHLSLPRGYCGLDSLLILLAFMALARLKSIESLRYRAPGEWGNLLGLDRVPEVRTLRAKIQLLARDEQPAPWSAALCERWMAAVPEQAGVLYIDGHVRVYHGHQTQPPRHYVARERLCLRATTDLHAGVRPRRLLAGVSGAYEDPADRLPDLPRIPQRGLGGGGIRALSGPPRQRRGPHPAIGRTGHLPE